MSLLKRNKGRETPPAGRRPVNSQPDKSAGYTQYYRAQRRAEDPDAAKKPKSRWVRRTGNIILLAGGMYLLWQCLTLSPHAYVKTSSEQFHSKQQYQQAASKLLTGWQAKSKLTVDTNKLVNDFQGQFPEAESAQLSLPLFGKRPTLDIQVAVPALRLQSGLSQYIIDNEGKVISGDASDAQFSAVPLVKDTTNFQPQIGKTALTGKEVAFITTLLQQAKLKNFSVDSMELVDQAEELHVRTSDQPGYYVKFFMGGDALQSIGDYLAVKQRLHDDNIQPHEYIDARVPEKVYYK